MYKLIFPLFILSLSACTNDGSDKQNNTVETPEAEQYQTADQLAERHVEADLKIPGNENYSMKIYSDYLNDDDSIDYVITVNRYDKAMEDAQASGKIAKLAEVGFAGKHNYFYYMDGATKKFSSVVAVPSSPHSELNVEFKNITSDSFKDIMIDYHIMNGYFRNYYKIIQGTPAEFLRSELFIKLGEPDQQAYYIDFAPGNGEAKDVIVYEATIGEYALEHPDDIYKVTPERKKTDKVTLHWKYNPSVNKYYLEQ